MSHARTHSTREGRRKAARAHGNTQAASRRFAFAPSSLEEQIVGLRAQLEALGDSPSASYVASRLAQKEKESLQEKYEKAAKDRNQQEGEAS